ncbi:MAG: beta-propeller fold lactonase family protein [Sphaerochaeta sp.]|nr:beta-propeller fold lactonase family protein [Sphaerochaeta sp.]
MNTTYVRSRWLWIFLLCMMSLMLGGCKEESNANRSTLRLSMEGRQSLDRILSPQDTPLEVSRYTVEGTGPQGTTFSVMSNTPSVEVEGLLIGAWTIRAVGQNTHGVDLVDGQVEVTLTKEPTAAIIELDSLSGKGTMTVRLDWDATKIANPSLELWLTDAAGAKKAIVPTINNLAQGSVTYTGSYDAGSYLLQAKLYSGSIAVAGCVEVIRVVGNRTTEGSITLSLDKYADVPTSLTLINKLGVPVQCTIAGISASMSALIPATAELVALNERDSGTLDVTWYLDGQQISSAPTCTFTPSSGSHRLDVIAQGALLASSGSASISFTASVSGTAGVPIPVGEIADTIDGLHVGMDARAAFLPDGKILLASNQHQTIQVCRIVRDTLEVVHTYTALDGFNAAGVTDLFVDNTTYRVAIADSSRPGLSLYQYEIGIGTLTKLVDRSNAYFTKTDGTKETFSSITASALDRQSGILYSLITDAPRLVESYFYANSQAEVDTNHYVKWYKNYEVFDGLAISADGKHAALSESSTGLIKLFRKNTNGVLFSNDQDFATASGELYLNNAKALCFVNGDNLAYATDNDLGRFSWTGTTWTQCEVYTDDLNGIGPMKSVQSLAVNSLGNLLYVAASGSKNLLTFAISTSTGELGYLETTSLGEAMPKRVAVSPKNDHLIVLSENKGSLLLCKLP